MSAYKSNGTWKRSSPLTRIKSPKFRSNIDRLKLIKKRKGGSTTNTEQERIKNLDERYYNPELAGKRIDIEHRSGDYVMWDRTYDKDGFLIKEYRYAPEGPNDRIRKQFVKEYDKGKLTYKRSWDYNPDGSRREFEEKNYLTGEVGGWKKEKIDVDYSPGQPGYYENPNLYEREEYINKPNYSPGQPGYYYNPAVAKVDYTPGQVGYYQNPNPKKSYTILTNKSINDIKTNAAQSYLSNAPKTIGDNLEDRQSEVIKRLNDWEETYTDSDGENLIYKEDLTDNELRRAEELRIFYGKKLDLLNEEAKAFNIHQMKKYGVALSQNILNEMSTEEKIKLGLWTPSEYTPKELEPLEAGWSILTEKMKDSEDQLAEHLPFEKELESGLEQTESAGEKIRTSTQTTIDKGIRTPDWFTAGQRVEIPYYAKHTAGVAGAAAIAFPVTMLDYFARTARNPISTQLQMVEGLSKGFIEDPLSTGAELAGLYAGGVIYSKAAGRVLKSKTSAKALQSANKIMESMKKAQPFRLAKKYGNIHKITLRVDPTGFWEYGYELGKDGVARETWKWVEKKGTKVDKITVKDQIGTDIKLKYTKKDVRNLTKLIKSTPKNAIKTLKKISPIEKVTRVTPEFIVERRASPIYRELLTESGQSLGKRKIGYTDKFSKSSAFERLDTSLQLKPEYRAKLNKAKKSVLQTGERLVSKAQSIEIPELSELTKKWKAELSPWEEGVIGHEIQYREIPRTRVEIITESGKTIGEIKGIEGESPTYIDVGVIDITGKVLKPKYARIIRRLSNGKVKISLKELPENLKKALYDQRALAKKKIKNLKKRIKRKQAKIDKRIMKKTKDLPINLKKELALKADYYPSESAIVRKRVSRYMLDEFGRPTKTKIGTVDRWTKQELPSRMEFTRTGKPRWKARVNPETIKTLKELQKRLTEDVSIRSELAKRTENLPIRLKKYGKWDYFEGEGKRFIERKTVPKYRLNEFGEPVRKIGYNERFTERVFPEDSGFIVETGKGQLRVEINPKVKKTIKNLRNKANADIKVKEILKREIRNAFIREAKKIAEAKKRVKARVSKHYGPKERTIIKLEPEALEIIKENIKKKGLKVPKYAQEPKVRMVKIKPSWKRAGIMSKEGRIELAKTLRRIKKGKSKFKPKKPNIKKITPEQAKAISETLNRIRKRESNLLKPKRRITEITPEQAKAITETLRKLDKGESWIKRESMELKEITPEQARAISETLNKINKGKSNKEIKEWIKREITPEEAVRIAETLNRINRGKTSLLTPKKQYTQITPEQARAITETLRKMEKGKSKFKKTSNRRGFKLETLDDIILEQEKTKSTKGRKTSGREVETKSGQIQIIETKKEPIQTIKTKAKQAAKTETKTGQKQETKVREKEISKPGKKTKTRTGTKTKKNVKTGLAYAEAVKNLQKMKTEYKTAVAYQYAYANKLAQAQTPKQKLAYAQGYKTATAYKQEVGLLYDKALARIQATKTMMAPPPPPVPDVRILVPPIKKGPDKDRKPKKKKKKYKTKIKRYQDPYERFLGKAKFNFKWNTLLRSKYGNLYT